MERYTAAMVRSILAIAFLALTLHAQPLPLSSPEQEGFSKDRLDRLHRSFDQITRANKPPGAVTMVVRNGHIVDWQAFGMRDLEGQAADGERHHLPRVLHDQAPDQRRHHDARRRG